MPKKEKGVVTEPICNSCVWIRSPGFKMEDGRKTCPAFYPNPIPDDIWQGKNGHHEKHALQSPDKSIFLYELYDF